MQHGKEDARAHWKLQVADGMSEEFGSESGEYLYGFFGRFCQVWRVVEDGTVRLVQRGEKVPDWNGAFQENQHVDVAGSGKFRNTSLNRRPIQCTTAGTGWVRRRRKYAAPNAASSSEIHWEVLSGPPKGLGCSW